LQGEFNPNGEARGTMRLLIAYDGSKSADKALDDLTHAGLPTDGHALVMTVAEVWLPPPPPSAAEIVEMAAQAKGPLALERRYMAASQVVIEADKAAARAAEQFQAKFPKWRVDHEAAWGSPTWQLFSKAEEFKADLGLVGSHGRTSMGRIFLGSISQWLLHEAPCSVRIARGKVDEPDFPVRLIVGVDGSPNAELALAEVAARKWPEKSEVRVVVVNRPLEPTLVGELIPMVGTLVEECNDAEVGDARGLAEKCAQRLQAKGLRAEAVARLGDPKRVLVEFAEEWRADCIFLGATGLSNRLERFLLGSVAGAVAARANCSVEIVRKKRNFPRNDNNGNGNGN